MQIPLVDLKAQYATIADEVGEAIGGVLERCDFILGQTVTDFEAHFAEFIGATTCIGVGSGTDALWLTLRALGVGEGDEVMVPANTFIATAIGASRLGARVVLVDVDPGTYNMDPERLEACVSEKTKAVIPVHLYGQPVDMTAITAFAEKHGLILLEDACQAHGAIYGDRRCGSMGRAGCFSFYPGKNLGAYGDGGAITTSDEALAEQLLLDRNWGQRVKYHHLTQSWNSRLDSIQAAVLDVKLRHLDTWTQGRREVARRYSEALADVSEVQLPAYDSTQPWSHVFHLYVIRAERRDDLMAFLKERGMACGIHYPIPIHLTEAYRDLGYGEGDFPVTEQAAREIVSLPMFAELTDEAVQAVVDGVRDFYAGVTT